MIDRRSLPLNALRAFEAVARAGSFRAGAERLFITQSAISRHIANLEELIGRSLFDRSGRQISLSPAGERLLPIVRQGLDDIEAMLNELDVNRSVRVHMPPAFLGPAAMDLLRDFRRSNPGIAIEVTSSHETGIPEAGADIAIVFQRARVDDQVNDLLQPIRFVPLCAPGAGPRAGEGLADFLLRSELLNVRISGMPDDHLWQCYARQLGIALPPRASVTFATASAAAEFALGGDGVMLGDWFAHHAAQATVGLVAPFEAAADLGYGYYLSMRPEMLADPAVARFRKWLIERFAGDNGRAG